MYVLTNHDKAMIRSMAGDLGGDGVSHLELAVAARLWRAKRQGTSVTVPVVRAAITQELARDR